MIESPLYQPTDHWTAEPHEPQPLRRWRTRTVVLLMLLALTTGAGSTLGWMYWRAATPPIVLDAGQVAVLVDDPMGGVVATDEVVITVVEPSSDTQQCDKIGGGPIFPPGELPGQPRLCAIAVAPVIHHDRTTGRLIVSVSLEHAAAIHTLQAGHQPLTILPWQQTAPHADDEQSIVEPQE